MIAGLLFRLWLTNRSLAIGRQRVLMHSQALRDSEFRWQCALEGTGDGMWDWDLQDNRVEYSRGWLDMLGYVPGGVARPLPSLAGSAASARTVLLHWPGLPPIWIATMAITSWSSACAATG